MHEHDISGSRYFDLAVHTHGAGFDHFSWGRGIALTRETIEWRTKDGSQSASLDTIVSVALQSGGDWRNPIKQCRIGFRNGNEVRAIDRGAGASADEDPATVYPGFVRALCGRLAEKDESGIRFTAGYPETRYRFLMVLSALLAGICVLLPFGLLFKTGEPKVLAILVVGAVLIWPLVRMMRTNAPRNFSPHQPPTELL